MAKKLDGELTAAELERLRLTSRLLDTFENTELYQVVPHEVVDIDLGLIKPVNDDYASAKYRRKRLSLVGFAKTQALGRGFGLLLAHKKGYTKVLPTDYVQAEGKRLSKVLLNSKSRLKLASGRMAVDFDSIARLLANIH